jgi:diadenosine tetraphosphatase ApaH/serine/threonine PP2A family protein phosphatase
VWEYVLSSGAANACMDEMEPRVGAVGHSHVALWFHREGSGEVSGDQAAGGTELDLSSGDWIVNPGGVGQPRDGDPRAAWMLLDLDSWAAEWRRVEYPVEDAARAIRDAGLPAALADRLFQGQ